MKKFEFNLIISNPKGSSNVKLSVTLIRNLYCECLLFCLVFMLYQELCMILITHLIMLWLMAVIMFGYKHVEIPEIVILI